MIVSILLPWVRIAMNEKCIRQACRKPAGLLVLAGAILFQVMAASAAPTSQRPSASIPLEGTTLWTPTGMGLSLAVGRLWSWSVLEGRTQFGFGAGQFDGTLHYQYSRNIQGGVRLWVIAGRPDATSEFSQAIYALSLRWIKPENRLGLYHATIELGLANMSFYADTSGRADPDTPPLQLDGKGPSAELRYGWGRRYDNLLGLTASAGFRFGAVPLGDTWQPDMTLLAQFGVSRSLLDVWPDAEKLCKGLEIGFGVPIAWKAMAATPQAQVFGPYLERRLLWSVHGDIGIVF